MSDEASGRKLYILASPAFVISLLLLLANDFVFKAQFHNQLTGKLSDFAGLFAFSLFWAAFFPRKRILICTATAVLFVFWKSVYSQFLIDAWNDLPFFGIGRTVDYSDLWALIVLPLACFHVDLSAEVRVPRTLVYLIAIVSVFAFTATSYHQKFSFNHRYEFQVSKKELLERISRLPQDQIHDAARLENADTFTIDFEGCTDSATITVEDKNTQSAILLTQMHNGCPRTVSHDEVRQYFEKEFIDKLNEAFVTKSAQVESVWAHPPETNR